MKINSLELENFGGIKHQILDLDGKTTVFFGINGAGKSTILRAINILFARIIQKIVQGRYKQTINIENEDIRFGKAKTNIQFKICFDKDGENQDFVYSRSMERKTKHRDHSQPAFEDITNVFDQRFIKDVKANMPIFVNYGVHRVVLDIPLRIKKGHSFDKISAFEKAIENKIDFRTFFEWFRNQEDFENEIKGNENIDYVDIPLESVRKAIYVMIDGFSELRVKRSPLLRMTISKGNTTLEMKQLSDGEKCTMALIGDLARRLALANPTLTDPCHGKGIVLIDEIELHMHPTWQRRIISTLRDLFPNIQFIITTHSPQVLGEIDDTVNIFGIRQENNILVADRIKSLIAWDSNLILEELMGTSSLNTVITGKITRMFELIQDRNYEEANRFADEIDNLSHGNNPDVIKARILIARGVVHYDKNK